MTSELKEVRVGGKPFNPTNEPVFILNEQFWIVYRYEGTYPIRYVMQDDPALSECEACESHYAMWMCDDEEWAKLPSLLHKKHLCVECFRRAASRGGA